MKCLRESLAASEVLPDGVIDDVVRDASDSCCPQRLRNSLLACEELDENDLGAFTSLWSLGIDLLEEVWDWSLPSLLASCIL